MAAASAGSNTSITTAEDIYNNSNGCTSLLVRCPSGSAVSLQIHVDGLHDTDEWAELEAGTEYIFRNKNMGIGRVQAKGKSGTASAIWFVVAKT